MSKKLNFRDFSTEGSKYFPSDIDGTACSRLPAGAYTLHYDGMRGKFWFEAKDIQSDEILDLPSPEYDQITKQMQYFMTPEVKAMFNRGGYIYKRSVLLHGKPGTGKTVIVNRVARDIVNSGGVVLWANEPKLLAFAYNVLNDIQPDVLTGVIFEEFDNIVANNESTLLTLLDGQVQKNNVIYLATTNYLDKIPARVYRPGRMSSVLEVQFPNTAARTMYLEYKSKQLGIDMDIKGRVDLTDGLSIDELKEVVQAVDILKEPLAATLARLRSAGPRLRIPDEFDDEDGSIGGLF